MPRKIKTALLEKSVINEHDYEKMSGILTKLLQVEHCDKLIVYLLEFLAAAVTHYKEGKVNFVYKADYLDHIVRQEFLMQGHALAFTTKTFIKDPRSISSENADGVSCRPYRTYLHYMVGVKKDHIKALFAEAVQFGALVETKQHCYSITDVNKLKEYLSLYREANSVASQTITSSTATAFAYLGVTKDMPFDHIQVLQPPATINDKLINLFNTHASLSRVLIVMVEVHIKYDLNPAFIKLLLSLLEKADVVISEFDDVDKIQNEINRLTNGLLELPACANLTEFFHTANRNNRKQQYGDAFHQQAQPEMIKTLVADYVTSMSRLIPQEENCLHFIEKIMRQVELKIQYLHEPVPSVVTSWHRRF